MHLDLAWLPRAPTDFVAKCRALARSQEGVGRGIADLARYSLAGSQLDRLAGLIQVAIADGQDVAPLTPLTLGLACDFTSDTIRSALIATAARYGFALTCIETGYGQVIQDALSPTSPLNTAKPDVTLLALDYRSLPMRPAPGDEEASIGMVDAALDHVDRISQALQKYGGGITVVQTLARPPETTFGSLDFSTPGTWRTLCEAYNRRLADSVKRSSNLLLDVAGIAETVGLSHWHDPAVWNLAKMPMSDDAIPLYADHVFRLIAAWRGRSRRCLVLDLDNTVWGGVIGDDGLANIRIAEGDPVGEAYRSVQAAALALRERGVVLAVSSKNNDEMARKPFQSHPDMMLLEEHVAVFQANWEDKASNISAIAKELSLGLESIAFLDDNPAERGLVRTIVPQVFVPELPDDPALYARTLFASGAFETTIFSQEDRARASFYQANARRVALEESAGGVEAYLRSLDMEITLKPFDAAGRGRITQLINKSNQFNLTSRRYSEAEVDAAERDPDCFTLQVRLKDVFADNGMISVVIGRLHDGDLEIDTWLMSCRVLARGVETAVLQKICSYARAAGARSVVGVFRPTAKNKIVEHHYAKHGFVQSATRPDGTTIWNLDPYDYHLETIAMRVVDLTS